MTLQKINFTLNRPISIFFLMLGGTLLIVNVYGLFQPIPTYEEIKTISLHKQNLIKEPSKKTIKFLKSFSIETINEDGINQINEAFAKSIIHYWPKKRNKFYIYENWMIYLFQNIELRLKREKSFFLNIERFDWERVIQSGYGYCSQATLALYDFFRERGQKSEIISIYGHVLLGTKLNNEHYFMDADFNVVIKASIDEIYENPRIVEDAYIKAGQDLDKTKTISEMFKSQDNNWIGSRYDYYPKLSNFYLIVDILKWIIPTFLLLPTFLRKRVV